MNRGVLIWAAWAVFMIAAPAGAAMTESKSTPGPSAAEVHDPPPVFLELTVDKEKNELRYVLLMWARLYRDTFGFDEADIQVDAVAEKKLRAKALADWMEKNAPVWIDGVAVRPTVTELETHFNDVQNVKVFFRYSLPTEPKKIRYQWSRYVYEGDYVLPEIKSFFIDWNDLIQVTFEIEEPEFTWHAPAAEDLPLPVSVIGDRLRTQAAPTVPVPLLSAAVIFAAMIVLGAGGWIGLGRKGRFAVLTTALILAALCSKTGVWHWQVGEPEGERLPTEAEARDLFRSIHANVYRAFDYDDESAIYDTLSESVTSELLDRIYNEIYRSLIIREEGGAVAKVKAVSILNAEVEFPEDASEFRYEVACDWKVKGVVEHAGHRHLRTQRYRARYDVARSEGRWRLADVEILSQERVPEEEE